jgi:hypothetical protein
LVGVFGGRDWERLRNGGKKKKGRKGRIGGRKLGRNKEVKRRHVDGRCERMY